ncbi:MAG TPA: hypothetical protein VGR76_10550 [Candidatus Angelobacter sp.]|nr:hypothetical protein [Candidatus Angelobacter sp.]
MDGERTEPEHVIKTALAGPVLLAGHPFFQANAFALAETLLLVANEYADSVIMERSGEDWKIRHADCLRHCGNLLVTKVAQLCGGYEHARAVSMEQRETTHAAQHPEEKKNG